ncbi:MAG: cytochrome c oxidase subunit 3 [Saprospiraceae bacterium]|nr:cytochrome c oxidase subunit 3 [Saprospiraceae bacterium]
MESPEQQEYNEYQFFAFHPYNVLLTLILLGISVLFLSLTAGFVYNRVQNDLPPIRLPWIFLFNTLILLGGSATITGAKRAYRNDDTLRYQQMLWWTVALSLVFLVAQSIGWWQLFRDNVFLQTDNSAAYLYVLSGLHFAHVIAGLPFLGAFIEAARKRMKEPVSVLVYFSDPEKKLKLRLLSLYWHFLDGLWIYLVLFFAGNALLG